MFPPHKEADFSLCRSTCLYFGHGGFKGALGCTVRLCLKVVHWLNSLFSDEFPHHIYSISQLRSTAPLGPSVSGVTDSPSPIEKGQRLAQNKQTKQQTTEGELALYPFIVMQKWTWFVWVKVSLCSPGCPGFVDHLALTSQTSAHLCLQRVGLKVYDMAQNLIFFMYLYCWHGVFYNPAWLQTWEMGMTGPSAPAACFLKGWAYNPALPCLVYVTVQL